MCELIVVKADSKGIHEICSAAAALYNTGQFKGSDGLIDPTDPRYQGGGVHMGRDGPWYEEQLQTPGSFLIVAQGEKDRHLGHSLFFTEGFPPFAADIEWMRNMSGVNKLAYGYLTIVEKEFRGNRESSRISQDLFSARLQILKTHGVTVLGTEVFVLPQPNFASLSFHQKMGAVCVGGIGTHKIPAEVGTGTVSYAQFAFAVRGRIQFRGRGTFSVEE